MRTDWANAAAIQGNAAMLCEVILDSPTQWSWSSAPDFGFERLGVDQEPPPGTLMPTPTRIRSEARDENHSPIHLPTQSCSLGTLLHRSNRFSAFVNLILICDCDGQPVTLDVSPSNPRRINRLKVSAPPRYLENPVSSNCRFLGSDLTVPRHR